MPNKILGLRPDSLGLLLQMANINAESRVLLVDKTKGFLAGALIEKNVKDILHVELGGTSQQIKLQNEILLEYNFHPYQQKKLGYTHISNIQKASKGDDDFLAKIAPVHLNYFNSLLIVHDDFHPCEIVSILNDMVQSSGTITVFSLFMHPLAELRDYLTANKMAVFTRLEELWTREFQVLPMRTHPHMSMDGASGYILTAIKVV